MYIPKSFHEQNEQILHDFIVKHSFGLIVSQVDQQPFASHLPLLIDRTTGPHGTLLGHMARANPQWKELEKQPSLIIFSGPHTYISPSWYEAENVVPTWNYTAVHAYGQATLIHDSAEVVEILKRSVDLYESAMPTPWHLVSNQEFLDRLVAQIVAFRIEISSLEGKFKLSQNHSLERREKVIRTLANQQDENSLAIADLMKSTLDNRRE